MPQTQAFRREQKGVALAMAAALGTTIAVLALALARARLEPIQAFAERLQHVLQVEVFVVAWPVAAVANVARLRFFSEQDIAGSAGAVGSGAVQRAGAILQNTLEQCVVAIIVHLIVAATFDHATALIWPLVALFSVGRLLFWIGYKQGAKGRAFGFALTFYPSAIALLGSGIAVLVQLA